MNRKPPKDPNLILCQYYDSYVMSDLKQKRHRMKRAKLVLGELYLIRRFIIRPHVLVKFIKATPKGFNFLDVSTSKCVIRGHMYDKDFSGKSRDQSKNVRFRNYSFRGQQSEYR